MDERMHEALRNSRIFLLDNISMDDLMDYIIVEDIFSDTMLERIKAGRTNREKIRKMLDELGRRSHGCFEKFLTALRKASQEHCAEFVMSNYRPITLSEDPSSFVRFPFPVPASSHVGVDVVPPTGGNNVETTKPADMPLDSQVYPMNSQPRGLALLINVEEFVNMPRREGSKADMHKLYDLFQFLGIQAHYKVNCTAGEIRQYLNIFSEHEDLRNVCCLVVVILSHGGSNGVIYGSDGNVVKDDDIRGFFSISKCPLMANKPKLILIQACRGGQEDCASSTLNISNSSLMQECGPSFSSNSISSSLRTADMADICLIHSTLSGYVSYRHAENGSPFINAFCSEMKKYAAAEHLTDIMIKVNRLMATSQLPGDLRTLPSSTNTLTRKWYFNPPLTSTPTSL